MIHIPIAPGEVPPLRLLVKILRHLHGAVFTDVADAWSGGLARARLKTGIGAALGADVRLGHAVPLTGTIGVAHGLDENGETSVYLRAGLSF